VTDCDDEIVWKKTVVSGEIEESVKFRSTTVAFEPPSPFFDSEPIFDALLSYEIKLPFLRQQALFHPAEVLSARLG
jgi:hypothetical protein